MKAYTDLGQSKKLAEILPLESADMYYQYVLPKSGKIKHNPEIGNPIDSLKWYNEGYTFRGKREPITLDDYCVPCWTVGAIIELLPYDIKGYNLAIYKSYCPNEKTFAYELSYEGDFVDYEQSILVSTSSIELIDACYEMIIKLHEQKLL